MQTMRNYRRLKSSGARWPRGRVDGDWSTPGIFVRLTLPVSLGRDTKSSWSFNPFSARESKVSHTMHTF